MLFKRVTITKNSELPRRAEDYSITVNKANLPAGITLQEWPEENVFWKPHPAPRRISRSKVLSDGGDWSLGL